MKQVIVIIIIIVICSYSMGCSNGRVVENTTEDEIQTETVNESTLKTPIPPSAKETNINGLYHFDNGINYFSQTNDASFSDDVIRFEYTTPGLDTVTIKVVTYSLSEDKVLGEVTFPEGSWITGDLDDGGFYLVSLTSTEVAFYDRYCKETYNKRIDESDFLWNYVTISSDGKYLLYNRAIDGGLVLYSFATGQKEEIGDIKGVFIPVGYKEGYFYLRNYESGIFKVSPVQKNLEPVITDDINGFISTEYCIGESNSYFVITPLEDVQNRKMTPMFYTTEITMATNDQYFATVVNDERGSNFRIYDITDSLVSPEVLVPGFIQNVMFCGEDLVLIISHDSNAEHTLYYLYDLTNQVGFENIVISKADQSLLSEEKTPEWTGDAKTISLANRILDEYGVRIIYDTSDIDAGQNMYTSQPVDDKIAFYIMQRIEEVLKFFPEGMTQEIGNGQETWIYLCKELAYLDSGSTVEGIAFNLGKHPIIFIDTELSDTVFREILVHEYSHVIDYYLDSNVLNSWINLMPENIATSYVNSYKDEVDLAYTPYDNGETEVWFYDSYSKTFPTEDRAVIFQKMYFSYLNGKMTDEFETYENLRKKVMFYCEMLRNTFDSCKNADSIPWEEPFDYTPSYE